MAEGGPVVENFDAPLGVLLRDGQQVEHCRPFEGVSGFFDSFESGFHRQSRLLESFFSRAHLTSGGLFKDGCQAAKQVSHRVNLVRGHARTVTSKT